MKYEERNLAVGTGEIQFYIETAAVGGKTVVRYNEDVHLHAAGFMEIEDASKLLVREADAILNLAGCGPASRWRAAAPLQADTSLAPWG